VTGSLWSIRLTMTDGRQSPHFGSRNFLTDSCDFGADCQIQQLALLSCPDNKYVQGMRIRGLKDSKSVVFIETVGADKQAENWQTFDLMPGE
jgi:hypothetical protein